MDGKESVVISWQGISNKYGEETRFIWLSYLYRRPNWGLYALRTGYQLPFWKKSKRERRFRFEPCSSIKSRQP